MFDQFKRLIYLGGIYSIGSIFQKAMGFFFIPIYTTYLSPDDYGIVGLMSITISLTTRFIATPVSNGFIRYYHTPEYKGKQGLLLFNCFMFLAIQAFVLALLFYYFRNIISITILESSDLIHIVKLYTFILFFQTLSEFLLNFLRQVEKAKYFVCISWAGFIISSSFVLFSLIYLKIGVLALIYGSLLGSAFAFVSVFPVFWKYSTHKFSFSILGPPLRYGYPLLAQGFSNLLIQSGDRFVIKIFSSLSNVGVYGFGCTIAGIINFILVMPLKQAMQPIILKLEGEPEKLKAFVRNNCTYFYLAGMFLCLTVSLYSREAVEIMARNKGFWRSSVIVPILAFSSLQHGLGYFFVWGPYMAKKAYHVSSFVIVTAVVNIGLNFVFVPHWGILGAAFATLISYFVWNGLKIYYSAKFYGLYFELGRLVHITIVGIGIYLLSLFIANTDSLSVNMAIKFFILLIYPLVFFITRFFNTKEKEYIQKLWGSIRVNGLLGTYAKIKAL